MKNLNPDLINYDVLHKALKYFSKHGFTQIEVPWRVSKEAINVTFNSNESFKSDDKFLVGSAEQGFLELQLQGKLTSSGQYMSVSPCFRNEVVDYYHQQEFIKLELIYFSNHEINKDDVQFVTFRQFVVSFITKKLNIKPSYIIIMQTNDKNSLHSEDILINGFEYGSYGVRKFNDIYYIYGTGIALPRFSKIYKTLK